MITNKDVHKELEVMDAILSLEKVTPDQLAKASLKALTLQIKLMKDIRTNMVSIMKHLNIPLKQLDEGGKQSDGKA